MLPSSSVLGVVILSFSMEILCSSAPAVRHHSEHRVSLSMMIGGACPAVRCPVGIGRNITVYSKDCNEEKQECLIQLLCSLITLLQGHTDPQLETFITGGKGASAVSRWRS